MIGKTISHYRILEKLSGNMGIIRMTVVALFLTVTVAIVNAQEQPPKSTSAADQSRLCQTLRGEAKIAACREAIRVAPAIGMNYRILAEALLDAGKPEEAQQPARGAVNHSPDDPPLHPEAFYDLSATQWRNCC